MKAWNKDFGLGGKSLLNKRLDYLGDRSLSICHRPRLGQVKKQTLTKPGEIITSPGFIKFLFKIMPRIRVFAWCFFGYSNNPLEILTNPVLIFTQASFYTSCGNARYVKSLFKQQAIRCSKCDMKHFLAWKTNRPDTKTEGGREGSGLIPEINAFGIDSSANDHMIAFFAMQKLKKPKSDSKNRPRCVSEDDCSCERQPQMRHLLKAHPRMQKQMGVAGRVFIKVKMKNGA